ncbi:MAG: acyltransferase [Woeseiaceae bacterium]
MTAQQEFNQPIHAFRGFAILNIVIIHAFGFVFYLAETMDNPAGSALHILNWVNSILFHDSTLYFTFISGILFSMILQERGYARFFTSKLGYVFLPYLFFTALFTFRNWPFDGGAAVYFDGTVLEFVEVVARNLLTGGAVFTLWYIPVLFVLYIATPLFAKLLATKGAKWLNVAIILSPLIISRVWPDISWTNYAYFLGAYMLGMYAGANYRLVIEIVRRHTVLFIATAIGATAALVALFILEDPGWGVVRFTETAWYVQKIAISGLVLLWFERSITTVPKWLDVLGNYAFAIYFLHGYLLFEIYGLMVRAGLVLESGAVIIFWAIAAYIVVIAVSVLITFAAKTALRGRSRYFLGA